MPYKFTVIDPFEVSPPEIVVCMPSFSAKSRQWQTSSAYMQLTCAVQTTQFPPNFKHRYKLQQSFITLKLTLDVGFDSYIQMDKLLPVCVSRKCSLCTGQRFKVKSCTSFQSEKESSNLFIRPSGEYVMKIFIGNSVQVNKLFLLFIVQVVSRCDRCIKMCCERRIFMLRNPS